MRGVSTSQSKPKLPVWLVSLAAVGVVLALVYAGWQPLSETRSSNSGPELTPAPVTSPATPIEPPADAGFEEWVAAGNQRMDAQLFGDAIRFYSQALWVDSSAADVWVDRGACKHGLGDAAGAIASSERSLRGTLTPRLLIERVQDLAFGQDPARARRLVARAGHDAAHLVPWLRSLVDVGDGQVDRARADVERLPLPSPDAPLVERLLVARALDAVGDLRRRLYRRALLEQLEPSG